MKRVPRPKVPPSYLFFPLAIGALWPLAGRAQVPPSFPMSSTYATRDGRVVSSVIGCASTDGSFTAQPCGVAGHPMHVQVDGGAVGTGGGGGTPTTAPGAAPAQVVGVQGGGAGALPVAVSQSGVWTLTLPSGAHVTLDAGGNVIGAVTQSGAWSVAVSNLPATQPVSGTVTVGNLPATQMVSAASLPLPGGAATAANQPALHTDGGALVHLTNPAATQTVTGSVSVSNLPATQAVSGTVSIGNLPATQAVTAANLPLPAGAATAANQPALNPDGGSLVHLVNPLPAGANTIGTVLEANRSAAWTDASLTATATATTPLAAAATRTGLHVWNVGSATVCLNYTAAAVASAAGCAPGSVPIPAGTAYLEDQPGNVSPEAISLVCAGPSCPLTIKVR